MRQDPRAQHTSALASYKRTSAFGNYNNMTTVKGSKGKGASALDNYDKTMPIKGVHLPQLSDTQQLQKPVKS